MNHTSLFDKTMEQWEAFLRASPHRFIRVRDLKGHGRWITHNGTSLFFGHDIYGKYRNVGEWFDALLLKHDLKRVLVLRKQKKGSGTQSLAQFPDIEIDTSARLKVLKNNPPSEQKPPKMSETTVEKAAPGHTVKNTVVRSNKENGTTYPQTNGYQLPLPSTSPPSPTMSPPAIGLGQAAMHALGGAAEGARIAGLGVMAFADIKNKAERADEYKEELAEYKSKFKKAKAKIIELKSQVATAEKAKELAVLEAKIDNKGFWDKIPVDKLAGLAAPLMEVMAAKNGGHIPQGLAAPSNLSETKQLFMEYLSDPRYTDDTILLLEQVMHLASLIPAYVQELQQLNIKYGKHHQN